MSGAEVLWEPDPEAIADAEITRFRQWVNARHGLDLADYDDLWQWSITDLEGFWAGAAQFLGVRLTTPPTRVLDDRGMPDVRWFPGATLNYADQALTGRPAGDIAIDFTREDGRAETLTYGDLTARVAAFRAALVELGVARGDRVVALAPNIPETVVAFLAAASIGAVWASCSPDFGMRAVLDRFQQIEPAVLIAVDGYVYGGKTYDIREKVDTLREHLGSLRATVVIDAVGGQAPDSPPGGSADDAVVAYRDLLARHAGAEPTYDPVEFDHPLWVLYSSGTTGLPKGIVQSQGGIVLEHLRAIVLQQGLRPGTRFFWYTTTGWMMWNYLVGGLLAGTTLVMYDGSPGYPDLRALWRLAQDKRVEFFGTSAPFVHACLKAGLEPAREFDLSRLTALGSTGAPLSVDGFRWIADHVGRNVQICSVSGGTDVCSVLVGSAPDVPVWLGELSRPSLGVAAFAFDDAGERVVGEVGELVITRPMPSMPISLWNDPDGSRLHEAYFDMYPGIWRHGDWIEFTERGSAVIHGRSDSTLNRGGIRMGTAEFYRVVEAHPEIADSLVIDTSAGGEEGALLCFVVLAPGADLADIEPTLRAEIRTELSPRHVPDRFIPVAEVPRTLNGKKCEVPVKRILAGVEPERAVSRDALANPAALDVFIDRGTELLQGRASINYSDQQGALMTTTVSASSVLIPSGEELAAGTPIVPGEVKVYPLGTRPGITLMLIAFDAGAVLPSHIAKGPIIIQTVTGEVAVEAEGRTADLHLGGLMHIDARVEHVLRATVRSRVLLTLFEVDGEPEVPGIIKKATAAEAAPDLIPVTDVSGRDAHGREGGGCDCGEEDEALPELDVRTIPHAIRHATVFGALQGLGAQQAMVLTAHHNPLPLLRQIDQLFSGGIDVSYLEEGPEVWRLKLLRTN